MSGRLEGKTAIITGAGQGIGRAIALAFADEGARVVATSRSEGPLTSLAGEHHAIDIRVLDAADGKAVDELAESFAGSVNVLVNCAGYVHDGTILDCTGDDWDRSFAVNATAMFHTCRAFLPRMLDAGCGSIVNVASVASSITGVPRRFAYAASKAAVIGLSKSLARDFIGAGIRCNALCPGTTDSPSLRGRAAATGDPDKAMAAFVARQPMGRLGKPEELAALAVYLASDESAYTTGAVFVADGGQTM